jgi:arginase
MLTPSLVQVPYMCGDGAHPASAGPRRSVEAARELLAARGAAFQTTIVEAVGEREGPAEPAAASWRVNDRLASAVRQAIASRRLPIVLAGSCDAALGVLAGFEHSRCGVVWLDAHGDFNTPESSVSGFFPGMTLATVVGHCHRDRWAQIGSVSPVAEDATALIGVRDLSPDAERERLEASAVETVGWRDGLPERDALEALDDLAQRVDEVYLHVDLDAFDPDVAPGVVDDPVPGGLSVGDGEAIVRAVLQRFEVRAGTLAAYLPAHDGDGRTLDLQVRLIELLAGL